MHRIAIVNQKGGCGKTTTAINLAGVLARRGLRTLLVDMDPQGHCAAGLAIPEQRIDLTIGDAMLAADPAHVDPARLLWRVSRNLDLAPATMRLAGLEAARGELAGRSEPERALLRVLARFDALYDVCLIDCSPAIGLLTFNALAAAQEVLIPVETGFFAMQGASKQVNTIKSLARRLIGGGEAADVVPPHFIVPTMHDERSVLSSDLLQEMKRRFEGHVAPVVIRFDQSLKEAASFGQPVVEYSPDSVGAQDYGALADWLISSSLQGGAGMSSYVDPLPAWNAEPSGPAVHVVSGIASRVAIPGVNGSASGHSAAAVAEPPAGIDLASMMPPAPGQALAGSPSATRAADLVARARKLQQKLASEAVAPAAAPVERAREETKPQAASTPAPLPASTVLYGVRATPEGVRFVQPASLGRVSIAGDFNGWSADAHPLTLNPAEGVLEALVPLRPGVAQYRLVVDGQWMPDPHNPLRVPNPYGGTNSLIAIPDFSRVGAPVN